MKKPVKSTSSKSKSLRAKQSSTKQGRPHKDYGDVQGSIRLGSPEALAKKILSTPPKKGKIKNR